MTGKVANMSTYSQGFEGGLNVRGENLALTHPGKVFWVGDGDTAGASGAYPNRKGASDGNKGTFLAPFKTADYAVGQCVAERGDIIYLLPGYNEAIESATELVLDVDGIAIVGLGRGTDQASWTYDTETASVTMTGANMLVTGVNLHNTDTSEATAAALIVSGAGNEIVGNRFTNNDADTNEWVSLVDVEAVANTSVIGNTVEQSSATVAGVAMVQLNGACTDTLVKDNKVKAAFTKGLVQALTTASVGTVIEGNEFVSGGTAALDAIPLLDDEVATTSGDGWVRDNTVVSTTAVGIVDTAGTEVYFLDNNRLATTAGVASLAEGSANGQPLQAVTATANADETGIVFDVTGAVDVWALFGVAEAAGDGTTSSCTISTEASASLWADAENIIDDEMAAIGDIVTPATGGGAPAVTELGEWPSTLIWPSPVRIPASTAIDLTQTGTGGTGVIDFTIVYTAVSADGAIADE